MAKTGINYHQYIQSEKWRDKAIAAKLRAGNRCQVCNKHAREVQLDTHHRTYERLGNELPEDLTVLCHDCHQLYESSKKLPKLPAKYNGPLIVKMKDGRQVEVEPSLMAEQWYFPFDPSELESDDEVQSDQQQGERRRHITTQEEEGGVGAVLFVIFAVLFLFGLAFIIRLPKTDSYTTYTTSPTRPYETITPRPNPSPSLTPTRLTSLTPTPVKAITTTGSNIRTGPGTNYSVIQVAKKGESLNIVGQNETALWYQLDSGGWISASLVNPAPEEMPIVVTPVPPVVAPKATATVKSTTAPQATKTIAPPATVQVATPTPTQCNIKGNISYNTGEKIYHVPGQKYYNATQINTSYGERWFCSEDEAKAAGWRRSYE